MRQQPIHRDAYELACEAEAAISAEEPFAAAARALDRGRGAGRDRVEVEPV